MAETGKKRYPEYQRVYDVLRSRIASGEYATKSLLPPEPELEEMFQVSRTTVRKAVELGLPEGTPLVCINRIQTANGSPITIAKNYIAASLVPDLEHTKEKIVSWYAYLGERYGLTITGAKDMISACNASFEESELLQIAPGSALLTIHRICSGEAGPIEVDQVKIVASRYELEVFMQG